MTAPLDPDPRHVGDADQAYQDGYIAGEYIAGLRPAPSLRRGLLILAVVLALGFVAGRVTAANVRRAEEGAPIKAAAEVSRTAVSPDAEVGASSPATSDGTTNGAVAGDALLEDDGGGISSDSLAQGRTGVIAQSVIGGPNYLAIPIGPGHLVDVCGPASCWRAVSTDAGPNHDELVAGRIADVALGHWLEICGLPAIRGTCRGSWHVVERSTQTLPPTDSAP